MEETRPKAFVFVLMPFSDDFTDIYELGIKAACKDAGAYCERVDEQIFDEDILQRVFNQISKADIIVAEMTGRNPNVFYETGYAHALGKRVILLVQDAKDIPFDLKHFSHVVYGKKIVNLKEELERRVRWCIRHPKESLQAADFSFEYFIDQMPLAENPVVEVPLGFHGLLTELADEPEHEARFAISVHNLSVQVLDSSAFSLALVIPQGWSLWRPKKVQAELPDGRRSYSVEISENLFPDQWYTATISLQVERNPFVDESGDLQFVLREFSKIGRRDYPFTVRLVPQKQK